MIDLLRLLVRYVPALIWFLGQLGNHHLHLGLRQVIHGKKAILGRVVNGPIGVSPRVSQKDQDPTDGPRMTRRKRTDDGESDQQ